MPLNRAAVLGLWNDSDFGRKSVLAAQLAVALSHANHVYEVRSRFGVVGAGGGCWFAVANQSPVGGRKPRRLHHLFQRMASQVWGKTGSHHHLEQGSLCRFFVLSCMDGQRPSGRPRPGQRTNVWNPQQPLITRLPRRGDALCALSSINTHSGCESRRAVESSGP